MHTFHRTVQNTRIHFPTLYRSNGKFDTDSSYMNQQENIRSIGLKLITMNVSSILQLVFFKMVVKRIHLIIQ